MPQPELSQVAKTGRPLIVLLTDFGQDDWYVGTMKGVIKGICPEADIVDLSHSVTAQSIIEGALMLSASYRYFPPETIFVAVVDPGVGTAREPVVVRANNQWFIAPNNGIVATVIERSGGGECHRLDNPRYFLDSPSATFHGRDVFAPAAAHLAAGVPLAQLAPQPVECFRLVTSTASYDQGIIEGNIVYFDHFGNAVTNIPYEMYQESMTKSEELPATGESPAVAQTDFAVTVGAHTIHRISKTYAEAEIGKAVAYWGSMGTLEIAINHGNLCQQWDLMLMDKVTVKRVATNAS